MSNLKIDIIYYKTSSDFEMEFNLSGCCRMRMFKDKIETPKGLVNTLARDVARSKIILIVTDLFGEYSGIPTISRAIGLPLVSPNKNEYGIKTTDDIRLPETAVPLVTKSGIYGGCIIESGPQSIIIVSSVRALRHEIMKAYVHNYVFDVGQLLAYQERMGVDGPSAMPPIARLSKAEVTAEETTPNEVSANEAEAVSESQDTALDTAINYVMEKKIKAQSDTDTGIIGAGINATAEIDIASSPEEIPVKAKKPRKRRKAANIILLIIVVLLLIGFGILAYYFVYLPLIGQPSTFTNGEDNIITEFLNGLFA